MEAHRLTLRATSGFRHAGNRAAMNKWVEHAAAARRARVALARGAHARVAACLRTWLDATLNRKASRAEAAAARMVHAPLGRAFTHWAVVVAEVNYRRKAMAQFFNAGASKALRSWKALSAERAIMGRGARAMFATSLRRGLTTWSAFARESALAKEQMLRAKSSLSGDVRGRALRTWASRLQEVDVRARALAHFMDAERSSAFASWVEETVRWLLLRKALSSLSAKELKRGLNGWREWKDERARKASAAKASARKLSAEGRAVMRAYNQMRHVALISAPLKTALVRLTKRQLVKACMSWRAWTDTRREMRRLGANLVSSPTVRALRTWRHHSELAKRRLDRLEAQVRRMVGAPELRALRSWRAVTAKHMLLRRAGHGVMGSALFKGLKSWMQHCQQKAEKKKALAAQARTAVVLAHPYCEQREGSEEVTHRDSYTHRHLRARIHGWCENLTRARTCEPSAILLYAKALSSLELSRACFSGPLALARARLLPLVALKGPFAPVAWRALTLFFLARLSGVPLLSARARAAALDQLVASPLRLCAPQARRARRHHGQGQEAGAHHLAPSSRRRDCAQAPAALGAAPALPRRPRQEQGAQPAQRLPRRLLHLPPRRGRHSPPARAQVSQQLVLRGGAAVPHRRGAARRAPFIAGPRAQPVEEGAAAPCAQDARAADEPRPVEVLQQLDGLMAHRRRDASRAHAL
eukprot:5011465-Pleurochrysis_carterae.AAC.1